MEKYRETEFESESAHKSRIFIGGLGKNVTEDEIRKTFSGLGEAEAVEIYRTKGRSFAYLDFAPSSNKSLPKLFSTYNGCMWKGGRLKLEKAKEHYLVRLKREWAEDTKLAKSAPSDVNVSQSKPALEKPKKVIAMEKPSLRIFFPKLNKMKALAFSGSGKHKYSFQRTEVPPLPIHFCDCEEHSVSFHREKGAPFDLKTANAGIREEELNIMESVMKKLFERETHSKAVPGRGKSTEERGSTADPVHLPVDENESEPPSDEDNLIINMVAGGNGSMPLLGNQAQKRTKDIKELAYGRPVDSLHKSQRKKIEPYSKKRKLPLAEVNEGNGLGFFDTKRNKSFEITSKEQEDQSIEPKSHTQRSTNNISWSQKSAWKDLVGKKGDTSFRLSNVAPSVHSTKEEPPQISPSIPIIPSAKVKQPQISHAITSIPSAKEEEPRSDDLNITCSNAENKNALQHKKPESEIMQSKDQQVAEAPALSNDVSIKIARGASWRQKSSWTQLVADSNKNSFSISQVLPGLSFEKQELVQPNGTDIAANSSNVEHHILTKLDQFQNTGHSLKVTNKPLHATPSNPDVITLSKSNVDSEQTTRPTFIGNHEGTVLKPDARSVRKPISVSDFGETCSFMRNADSLKEWAKAKAALSGSLKKKGKGEVEGK